jgi:RNA polymerase sigma-70 factor (ECF subfamily)
MEDPFTNQVADHALALKGYALFLTQNRDDAHDLLQETYLKAFSNRDRFAPDTNLKGWLYTIMKNTFINTYRRKVKRNTFADHTEQDFYINQASQHIPNQAESKMVMEDLNAAIALLPFELREAFVLNFRGHKYQDIADRFGIPIGTVKTRIHLARKALKRKLSIYGDLYGLNAA